MEDNNCEQERIKKLKERAECDHDWTYDVLPYLARKCDKCGVIQKQVKTWQDIN